MKPSTYVTIMLIPDGTDARHGLRMRVWVLKLIVAALIALLIGIALFFSFYGQVLTRAAMAGKLKEENEQLRRYQFKVQLLEENLKEARRLVNRLTELAGIDFEFTELPDDSTLFASFDAPSAAILTRDAGPDLTWPSGLPMQGFISQDFEIESQEHYHPGVDIACAEGTPVLTTAAGTVVFADYDSTYGHLIVVQHSDTVMTLYGHNSEILVEAGQKVMAGSRIALSGNTGKSTAPHLHYEVRVNDEPIDPMSD